jgi:hypothetical protein
MKMIRPIVIDETNLTSTNVPETIALYNPATTYALGALVRSTDHRIYESMAAGNVGKALSDLEWWLDIRPSNRWAMFDAVNSTKTEALHEIEVTITPNDVINSVALMNLEAESVTITAVDVNDGVVYDRTFELVTLSGITDFYEWFFEPTVRKTGLVVTDIPPYFGLALTVTINGTSNVSVGTLVTGMWRQIGETTHGASIGITDFSRKETDGFGNFILVERAYSRRGSFTIYIPRDSVDGVADLLAEYRAVPLVWMADEAYQSTVIFGPYKDWTIAIDFPTYSVASLEIMGLT